MERAFSPLQSSIEPIYPTTLDSFPSQLVNERLLHVVYSVGGELGVGAAGHGGYGVGEEEADV